MIKKTISTISLAALLTLITAVAGQALGWFSVPVLANFFDTTDINNTDSSNGHAALLLDAATNLQPIVTIGWVGDIVPGFDYATSGWLDDIHHITRAPDIMLGNFEGVITTSQDSKCNNYVGSSKCFAFKGDQSIADALADAGFDGVNLANNHSLDYDWTGRSDTVQAMQKAGIKSTGGANETISFVTSQGFTVAVIGASPYRGSLSYLQTDKFQHAIASAKQNHDIVVVTFHGGADSVSVTPDAVEVDYGESHGNLRTMAATAISAGADIIVGSGPHVMREIEIIDGKLVAFSLGNFTSLSNNFNTQGVYGESNLLYIKYAPSVGVVDYDVIELDV